MQAKFAPIVVFAYNRPDHLTACLESLAANPQARDSTLTIYCDGPKPGEDPTNIQAVREIAFSWEGNIPSTFAEIRVVEQQVNRGLANSVISGVSETLANHDRVIVVEDDLLVSPDFLSFMNQGLNLYENETDVISIHGFMYAVDADLGQSVFLRGADCWGWATWRRGWELFRPDSTELLAELKLRRDRKDFDFNGAFPYTTMLQEQAEGKIDSWAVRWYASAFLADKLTLYPGVSLVVNNGQGVGGTNFTSDSQARESHAPHLGGLSAPLAKIGCHESGRARKAIEASLKVSRTKLGKPRARLKGLLKPFT
jgi:glycosyltransferase involved in cell wall biosynthesis